MIDLTSVEAGVVTAWGREMFQRNRYSLSSFEDAAVTITNAVFKEFATMVGGPTFALVRIYRMFTHQELPEHLLAKTSQTANVYYVLMGTAGVEPAWCDRIQSQRHQAVPLGPNMSAMMREALVQLKMDDMVADSVSYKTTGPTARDVRTEYRGNTAIFFIPQTVGSPYIPKQDFVAQYGIQSALGLGEMFLSRSNYLMMAFSRTALDATAAERFAEMSPFVSTILASYEARSIHWVPA